MKHFIQDMIVNRVRQYGLRPAVAQVVQAAFRRVYEVNRDVVFIIPDFTGYTFRDPCVFPMTRESIDRAAASGELDESRARLLTRFIEEGSKGVGAEVNGKLAGYAWVQLEGEYTFGRTGRMSIPPQHALLKYLFVMPEFRGFRLGKKLNAARLALIPAGVTPVVFIIPENRYAIRNWEHYGFRRMIDVKRWKWWCHGHWHMRLTRLADSPEAETILKTLGNSKSG